MLAAACASGGALRSGNSQDRQRGRHGCAPGPGGAVTVRAGTSSIHTRWLSASERASTHQTWAAGRDPLAIAQSIARDMPFPKAATTATAACFTTTAAADSKSSAAAPSPGGRRGQLFVAVAAQHRTSVHTAPIVLAS